MSFYGDGSKEQPVLNAIQDATAGMTKAEIVATLALILAHITSGDISIGADR